MSDIVQDRYENRRKMAWNSFWAFSVMGTLIVFLGVFSPTLRDGIIAMWIQIAFVMGLWITVVGGYMASVYGTDKTEIMKDQN